VDGRAGTGTKDVSAESRVERVEPIELSLAVRLVEAGQVLAEGLLGKVRPKRALPRVRQVRCPTRCRQQRRRRRRPAQARHDSPRTRTATRTAEARKTERISSRCKNVGAGRASTAQGAPTVIARGGDGGYDVWETICAAALECMRSLSTTPRAR
jgi:hypothetical protein